MTVVAGAHPADHPVEMTPRGDLVERGPGVPIAISFLGRRFSEETLIAFAYAFEQASAFCAVPRELTTAAHARDSLKRAEDIVLPTTQLIDVIAFNRACPRVS